jgi:polysaccharide pyruvyl transferase WcaK-like protein
VVQEILADLRENRPDVDPSFVIAEPVSTFDDIMQAMSPVGSVVAIRFHNILAALKLCKPTLAISYSAKHDTLMEGMGLAEFRRPVNALETSALIDQFTKLETRSAQLRQIIARRNEEITHLLDKQFAELSAALFLGTETRHNVAEYEPAREA